MKIITQTGRIPVSSIGVVIGNYLKFFKVFFVFYFLPQILTVLFFFISDREKSLLVWQKFLALAVSVKTKNPVVIAAAKNSLGDAIAALISTPTAIAFGIFFLIAALFLASCYFVGLKHTFYKKVSIAAILQEGFSKAFELLWTGISMVLVWILCLICGLLIFAIPVYVLGAAGLLFIVPMIVFFVIMYSMFVFYIPIHFFSDNGPISSAILSCKTFWSSFLFIIVYGIALLPISFVVSLLASGIGHLAFNVVHNTSITVLLAAFNLMIGSYIGQMFVAGSIIGIFVAYPELLDENEVNKTLMSYNGSQSMDYPTEIISRDEVKLSSENNYKMPSLNEGVYKPTVKTTDAGEGLSVPNSHKNDRPFLNQKLEQTEFDRLTSKGQDQ